MCSVTIHSLWKNRRTDLGEQVMVCPMVLNKCNHYLFIQNNISSNGLNVFVLGEEESKSFCNTQSVLHTTYLS